uniref:Tenascin n=1 Tax=Magallana gigas TaxID=29159 RepID=K1R7J3_MAGGI
MIETKTTNLSRKVEKNSDHITTTQTEQRLLKQEMESLNSKADTLVNKSITNCADILDFYPDTREKDGVYNIIDSKTVYCDMTTDNGGWTVIQRRVNGSVDFYRNWTEYKNGFGFGDHEYWIGNDMLHKLTSLKTQELRADMERFNGEKAYAVYSRFSVGDETSKYKLEVQGYSGNAGDSLDYSNNMMFSTLDQDNDGYSSSNCATALRSAGWFYRCYWANPNGEYTDSEKTGPGYISWYDWKHSHISLKSIQLMIRPRP